MVVVGKVAAEVEAEAAEVVVVANKVMDAGAGVVVEAVAGNVAAKAEMSNQPKIAACLPDQAAGCWKCIPMDTVFCGASKIITHVNAPIHLYQVR